MDGADHREPLTTKIVIRITSDVTGISPEMIYSPSKQRDVSRARHIACRVAYQMGRTCSAISHAMGRDLSTIRDSVQSAHRPENEADVAEIKRRLLLIIEQPRPMDEPFEPQIRVNTPEWFALINDSFRKQFTAHCDGRGYGPGWRP